MVSAAGHMNYALNTTAPPAERSRDDSSDAKAQLIKQEASKNDPQLAESAEGARIIEAKSVKQESENIELQRPKGSKRRSSANRRILESSH
jgi:hypothetical protein